MFNNRKLKTFILAITTYNRLDFLSSCITSWDKTKTKKANWELVIADDGSEDGTIEYIESLKFEKTKVTLLKNRRIGIHQQMNTIIEFLETAEFDFCFKVDDDISFLKPGWDNLYYDHYIETGQDHLVFFEKKWEVEQHLNQTVISEKGEANIELLNVHGFFYTLTKTIIKQVGYFDYEHFYFRGMGHVDYTARCCRAGFNNIGHPFDVPESNNYISAFHKVYSSALKHEWVSCYDTLFREEKVNKILENDRVFVAKKEIEVKALDLFKDNCLKAMTNKLEGYDEEKNEVVDWYKNEIMKISDWNDSQYGHLPNWFLQLGKIFKLLSKKNK